MSKSKSFTLIELLVVIVIIGVLASVIIISTSGSISKAKIAKSKAFSESVKNNLMLNLVSEWSFDNFLSPYEDMWGNNNGSCTNCPIHETRECVNDGCVYFQNDNTYILLNNFTILKNSGTISFWAKKSNTIQGAILARNAQKYYSFLELSASGNVYGEPNTNDHVFPVYEATANDHNWHNYVLVFANGYSVLYFDSKRGDNKREPFDNLTVNSLGASTGTAYSHYFKGYLDEVKIYNAALSSSKIKQNYVAGLDSLLAQGNISKQDYNQRIKMLAYEK